MFFVSALPVASSVAWPEVVGVFVEFGVCADWVDVVRLPYFIFVCCGDGVVDGLFADPAWCVVFGVCGSGLRSDLFAPSSG